MSRPLSMLLPAVERPSLEKIIALPEIRSYVEKRKERILYGSQKEIRYAVAVAVYACDKTSQFFAVDGSVLEHVVDEVATGEYFFDARGISYFKKLTRNVRTDVSIFKKFSAETIEKFLEEESQELAKVKRKADYQANFANEAADDLAHSLLIPNSKLTKNQ